jgi:hypothetical protein
MKNPGGLTSSAMKRSAHQRPVKSHAHITAPGAASRAAAIRCQTQLVTVATPGRVSIRRAYTQAPEASPQRASNHTRAPVSGDIGAHSRQLDRAGALTTDIGEGAA